MAFLKRMYTVAELIQPQIFPFTLPLFALGIDVEFSSDVTLFVGENGAGKSTILEAWGAMK